MGLNARWASLVVASLSAVLAVILFPLGVMELSRSKGDHLLSSLSSTQAQMPCQTREVALPANGRPSADASVTAQRISTGVSEWIQGSFTQLPTDTSALSSRSGSSSPNHPLPLPLPYPLPFVSRAQSESRLVQDGTAQRVAQTVSPIQRPHIALLIPLFILVLLLLGGSFWVAYDTGLVVAAIPALIAPLLPILFWTQTKTALPCKFVSIFLIVIFAALALFVAALVVCEVRAGGGGGEVGTKTAEVVVCHLSPIVLFFVALCASPALAAMPMCQVLPLFSVSPRSNDAFAERHPLHPNDEDDRKTEAAATALEEAELSSILLTQSMTTQGSRSFSTRVPPVLFASRSFGQSVTVHDPPMPMASPTPGPRPTSSSLRLSQQHQQQNHHQQLLGGAAPIGPTPQERSVTVLYVAFRDAKSAMISKGGLHAERAVIAMDEPPDVLAARFGAVMDAARALMSTHGPFALAVQRDVVGLVWGVFPMSADPVMHATGAALALLRDFVPPSGAAHRSGALVAAVLQSPRALVSVVAAAGEVRAVHFLSAEHTAGEQLLSRGLLLRGYEWRKAGSPPFATSGLIVDRRAAHHGAAQFLSRPVGIIPLVAGHARRDSAQSPLHQFHVVYDFVRPLDAQHEVEWHLAAQERDKLSAAFLPLVEAAQAFHQGDLKAAREGIAKAMAGNEADPLLHLMMADIDHIASVFGSRTESLIVDPFLGEEGQETPSLVTSTPQGRRPRHGGGKNDRSEL